jgi:hypothetical protein
MSSNSEDRYIRLEGESLYHLRIRLTILTFLSTCSHQRKRSQSPFRARSSRHLHICQSRLEQVLEISYKCLIIRRIYSMGRYCDLVQVHRNFQTQLED